MNEIGKKKKKLLVTGSTFPRWEGDTEPRFVLDISEELTSYFDVTVLVPAAPGAKERELMNGVKVIRYHYFPVHRWETLCYPGAILPRIKEKKIRILLVPFLIMALYYNLFRILPEFDAVHAHWIIPQGIIQSLFKKPYIVTGHGGDIKAFNKGFVKKLKVRCLKKADHITVVSNAAKSEVLKLCNTNLIDVIPMGCRTKQFGKQYRIENYFQQGDKKVILFVGRLAEIKGVDYLIEAMNKIDAILVIVGDGPQKACLIDQAKSQGEKIRFLGSKNHDELRIIYASSDIFVAPSITMKDGSKEGFGLVLLEAMASGLPIVASNSGGIIDLVHHGINGLLANEKDADDLAIKINLLLSDSQTRGKLAKFSERTAKEFDYKVIAKKYADIIENVMRLE